MIGKRKMLVKIIKNDKETFRRVDAASYEAGVNEAARNHKPTMDHLRNLRNGLKSKQEILDVLLTLEPGLKKYRHTVEHATYESEEWDLDGMLTALRVQGERKLHDKYLGGDRVVSETGKK